MTHLGCCHAQAQWSMLPFAMYTLAARLCHLMRHQASHNTYVCVHSVCAFVLCAIDCPHVVASVDVEKHEPPQMRFHLH